MENSRVLLLLCSLSKAEFFRFLVYSEAESTSVHRRELTLGLLNVLKKFYPNFWDKDILRKEKRKEIISKDKVFDLLKLELKQKKTLDDKTKNNIMSFLVQVIEDFIIVEELKKNSVERSIILSQALEKRNSVKLFEKTTNSTIKKIEQSGKRNSVDYNMNLWRMFHMQYFHPFYSKVDKNASVLLQKLINQLNTMWLIVGNMYNIEAQNRTLLFDEKYNTLDLLELEKISTYEFINRNPHLTEGYRLLNKLFKNGDEAVISDILQWYDLTSLELAKTELDKEELLLVHSLLFNYYGIQILRGKTKYVSTLFELYKKALQNGYLIRNGAMNQHHFITIVNFALSLNEKNWVKQFIKKYQNYLSEEVKSPTLVYTNLMLDFLKNTKEAYLNIYYTISQEQAMDAYFDILYRVLEIKTLYKLLKIDVKFETLLLARLGNFSDYLNNQKQINRQNVMLAANLNFIRVVKKLHLAREDRAKNKSFLKDFIQKREFISERAWLTKEIALV